MRNHLLPSTRHARAAVVVASLVLLAACGGGSSGTAPVPNPGSSNYCDANNAGITTARPTPGFSTGNGQVEIVANGNGDQLFQSYTQFDLNLIDNFGNRFVTGPLSLTNDNNGPHPFNSDFYYVGTVAGGLPTGDVFSVYLNDPNTNCTLLPVGQIQT